ncbi:MAG: hypothetical protein E6G97_01370 [Alphaproteobacteria bacterium]|nr:MAG: hypothetical protein E6G97_01370 [Alphaproteobacteria bacterium]
MTTIAFYAVQVLVGVIAFAAGCAKLGGAGVIVQPLELIGLGQGFQLAAGSLEVMAGLCLLFPRSGLIGAALLSAVTIGTLGATLGHGAAPRADAAPLVVVHSKQGWNI